MKQKCKYMLCLAMAVMALSSQAQTTVVMSYGDAQLIDLCSMPTGVIYDDGGQNGNYSNNFTGGVTLEATPGTTITLSGSYSIENCCDHLVITDGNAELTAVTSYNGSFSVSSTTGTMTVNFTSDGSTNYWGFELNWSLGGVTTLCSNTVSALTATATTATSVDLTWTADNAAGPFTLFYNGSRIDNITSTSYTLAGLSPSQCYEITVAPTASLHSRCCGDRTMARTQCGTAAVPFTEGFEDVVEGGWPGCWVQVTNFDDEDYLPQVVASHHAEGGRSLMLSCGKNDVGEHFGIVATPPIGTSETMTVTFSVRASHSGTVIELGECNETGTEYDQYGFTSLTTFSVSSTADWTTVTYAWTPSAAGRRLALRMVQANQYGIARRAYIDGLSVEKCGVRNLAARHMEYDQMEVLWDTYGSPTCDLALGGYGGLGDSVTFTGVSSPYTLTGLQADTRYRITVYPTCGGERGVARQIVARTTGLPTAADGYCSEFYASNQLPDDWTFILDHVVCSGRYGVENARVGNRTYGRGVNFRDGCSGANAYMVSERLTGLAGKRVKITYRGYNNGARLVVGTMEYPDDLSTFVPIDTFYSDSRFHSVVVEVPASSTGRHVALRTFNDGWYCDLTVKSVSVGSRWVEGEHIVHRRGTSLEFAWDHTYDTVVVEYGAAGFTLGSGTIDTFYNASSGTLTGLSTSTYYDVFIYLPGQTPCEDMRMGTRTATCDYAMPYCERFDGATQNWWDIRYGEWERVQQTLNAPSFDPVSYINGGRKALKLASWGFPYGNYSTVLLPDVEVDADGYVSFYAFDRAPESKIAIGRIEEHCENRDQHIVYFDTIEVQAHNRRTHHVLPIEVDDSLKSGRLVMTYVHNYPYSNYWLNIDELQIATVAYDTFKILDVLHDSVTFGITGLYGTDSADITLYGPDTLHRRLGLNQIATFGFGQLPEGAYYDIYIQLEEGGCVSYAGWVQLPTYGVGNADCYRFDNLLTDELPLSWVASAATEVTPGDELQLLPASSLVLHPGTMVANNTFGIMARGKQQGDSLRLGYLPNTAAAMDAAEYEAIDTLRIDTVMRLYLVRLPDTGAGRLCLLTGADTAWIDDVSFSACPIVRFQVDGTKVTCTQDSPAPYILYVTDSAGDDHREVYIDENPYTLEGLQMDTRYDLGWSCQYTSTGCPPTVSVRTGGTVPLPYCEDFEGNTGMVVVPPIWQIVVGNSSSHYDLDTWGPSLRLDPNGGKWMYVVMPPMESDSVLTLFGRLYCSNLKSVQIGILENGTDTSSFIAMWTNEEGGFLYPQVDLSDHVGKRVAIRAKNDAYIFRLHFYGIPLVKTKLVGCGQMEFVSSKKAPYWIHQRSTCYPYVDTILLVTDSVTRLRQNTCEGVYITMANDSTGYSCEDEGYSYIGPQISLPMCSDFSDCNTWPWSNRTYHSRSTYAWLECVQQGGTTTLRMRGNGSLWTVCGDPVTLDSIRHASMRIFYTAASVHDSLEVGVMYDAYDTSSFVAVDTLVYTFDDGTIQSAYVDFSRYEGKGRWIALHHLKREKAEYFDLSAVYIDSCAASLSAEASLERWNRVKIDGVHTPFYVEYFPTGTSWQGNTANPVMRIDSVPQTLILAPETRYDFYFRCDSMGTTCVPPQQVTTLAAPLEVPTCVDFDTVGIGEMPRSWILRNSDIGASDLQAHSGDRSLCIPIGPTSYAISPDVNIDSIGKVTLSLWYRVENASDRLVVGVMSNPYDLSTFHPVRTLAPTEVGEWQRGLVMFDAAPSDAHFIVLRARSNVQPGGRSVWVDDIYVSDCAAFDFSVASLTNSDIDLVWNQVGTPNVTITVSDNDEVVATYLNPTSPLHVTSLTPLHYYSFLFSSDCGDTGTYCTTNVVDSLSVVAPAPGVGCINATDLNSPQAVFFSGSYSNPYSHAGAVNYGSRHADSRHTVCYDTAQRDPRTGNLLRTIPEGYTSSVRLGNWTTNYYSPEAEGVIYSLYVDTASFELLLLRYAAVLQDPMHAATDQPRFRMELLDTNYNIIDSACTSADFIADQSLGWNAAADGVLWKDWTAVGVDLSAHAGEQVYFRLTTYDCNEGSHYGYAYFTLECRRKNMNTEVCGDVDSNTLSAPEGFHYRWYTDSSPATISTAQQIRVPSEDVTYYCVVSKIDNPACNFTISSYGGTRYPVADFDTIVSLDSCVFHVLFPNTGGVSKDGVNLIPGDHCETFYWDFGNGSTATSQHGEATYYLPGDYTVRLISGIASDACTDTAEVVLHLEMPAGMQPTDTTLASICDNESYTFFGKTYTSPGAQFHLVPVAGQECDSLYLLLLDVRPTTTGYIYDTACDSYAFHGQDYTTSGTYVVPNVALNSVACDSTDELHLVVNYSVENRDSIVFCPYEQSTYMGVPYDTPADFDTVLTTYLGCDSLVHVSLRYRDPSYALQVLWAVDSADAAAADSLLATCHPAELTLRDTTTASRAWQWTATLRDTVFVSSDDSLLLQFPRGSDLMQAYVHLVATDTLGCLDTLAWPVFVFESPSVDFKWNPDFPPIHDPIAHFTNQTQPDTLAYMWRIEGESGSDTSSAFSPSYRWGVGYVSPDDEWTYDGADRSGDHQVTLAATWTHHVDTFRTDSINWVVRELRVPALFEAFDYLCVDSVTKAVTIVNDYLQFPNLVTPNGDGTNDRWEVVGLLEFGNYSMNELWIYDRTGALVYHAKNIRSHDQFWSPAETHSPDGTYYYRFSAKGQYGVVKRNGVIEVVGKDGNSGQ